MPDPREEAVARRLMIVPDSELTAERLTSTARALIAAADAVDPLRQEGVLAQALEARENANAATLRAEGERDALRARLAEAEEGGRTLRDSLREAWRRAETAEADLAEARILVRSHEGLIGQLRGDMVRFRQQRDTLMEALEEIARVPHGGDGDSRACARERGRLARAALAAVKGREDVQHG